MTGEPIRTETLPQLLDDPQAGWVLRYIEVQNAPAVVGDDEEAIEHTEGDGWDRKEIHCCDRFPMVTEEVEPTLGALGVRPRSLHPAGNRPTVPAGLGKSGGSHFSARVGPMTWRLAPLACVPAASGNM
jgi:hypothetical protein